MPQVPYNPVPDVKPLEGTGARGISINAPEGAFGGGVASALGHLGQTASHVGDELFQRALALQQLQNETEAHQADANYMEKAGLAHADFNALQGEERVKAFPDHIKALKKLREDIRGNLSNPMTQKMFDSQSLSTMGRTIFNAAGAAATANKDWAKSTAVSQSDLDAQTVEGSPNDEVLYQAKKNRIVVNAQKVAQIEKGADEDSPISKDMVLHATSGLRLRQLLGLARTQPFEAGTKLAASKDELTESDYLKADAAITTQRRAVGAANISDDAWGAGHVDPQAPMSLEDMTIIARDKAKKLAPDDPILANHAVAALQTKWNQAKHTTAIEQNENQNIVAGAIQKGVRDMRELTLDPAVASAVNALPPKVREAIPGQINRWNASVNKADNEENFTQLKGLANNDVEAFLNTDLTKFNLSQPQIRALADQKAKLTKNSSADPRVGRAVGWMRTGMGSQLEALGVYRRTDSNKEDFDHFTGATQAALDEWQEAHKRPPTQAEFLKDIAPQIIQQKVTPGWLYGTSKGDPFFKQEMKKGWGQAYQDKVVSEGGTMPTEEQTYKAYIQMQFHKLYGPKGDTAK